MYIFKIKVGKAESVLYKVISLDMTWINENQLIYLHFSKVFEKFLDKGGCF